MKQTTENTLLLHSKMNEKKKKKVVIKEKLLSFTCKAERVESNSGAMTYISTPC